MFIKRAGIVVLTCGMIFVLTGCATILSGTKQTVTVQSYPAGAHVQVGTQTGITPAKFTLEKGKKCAIKVSHAPSTRVVELKQSFDPATLLNLIPPFWPGFIVDVWTGAITKYDTEVVSVDFRTPNAKTAKLTVHKP